MRRRGDGASCSFLAELNRVPSSRANSARLPVPPRRRPAPSGYHPGSSLQIVEIAFADSAAPTNKYVTSYQAKNHLDKPITSPPGQPFLVFAIIIDFQVYCDKIRTPGTITQSKLHINLSTLYLQKKAKRCKKCTEEIYKCFQLVALKIIKIIYFN